MILMNKKYFGIVGAVLILLLWWLWPKKETVENKIEEIPTTTIRQDLYLPTELPRIKSVNWATKTEIELPKIIKMSIQRQEVDEERENKIIKSLGINENNGFVDKINNIIEYTEEIKSVEQLKQTGNWNIEKYKEKLKAEVEELNEIRGIEIEWTEVIYQKVFFPRWVETSEKEAQSVEIRGDYLINGVRTSTYFGEAIRGTFNRNGELIKLYLSLRPIFIPSEEFEELINVEEASQSPIGMYGVVENGGIEKIDKVNITEAEIVEIYDNKRNLLKPYYWLEGNTYSENKPVVIKLLLKAEK